MKGFPPAYDGQENSWVLNCRYRFQPYYYELSETSNLGYQHRFPVLDYLVPDEGHGIDLDRTNDLASCRNSNLTGPTQTQNDTAQAVTGAPLVLNVLANDIGNDLSITDVSAPQHGTVTFTARSITYTPAPGFIGADMFTYTVSGGAWIAVASSAATSTVSVTVEARTVNLPLIRR